MKNIEQKSSTIIGNKGLKSSINRNQSYAQKRVTGLECLQNNVFSLFSRILKDSIILFTRHNSFQVKLSKVGFEFGVKRVFTIKKPSFLMRSQLDFNL